MSLLDGIAEQQKEVEEHNNFTGVKDVIVQGTNVGKTVTRVLCKGGYSFPIKGDKRAKKILLTDLYYLKKTNNSHIKIILEKGDVVKILNRDGRSKIECKAHWEEETFLEKYLAVK